MSIRALTAHNAKRSHSPRHDFKPTTSTTPHPPVETGTRSYFNMITGGATSILPCLFGGLEKIGSLVSSFRKRMEAEAETYAAKGDYEGALQIGLKLRGGLKNDITLDLKLAEWAKKAHNLVVAYEILKPHRAPLPLNIRDEARQKTFIELTRDPKTWVAVAHEQMNKGDYAAALEHLRLAREFAFTEPRFPRPGEWQVFRTVPRETVDAALVQRIEDEISAVTHAVEDLPDRVRRMYPEIYRSEIAPPLDSLSKLETRHIDLSTLTQEAKTKILAGILYHNQRLIGEGYNLTSQIERYTQLEPYKANMIEVVSAQRPRNSRFAFELDPSAVQGDVDPMEVPAEAIRNDAVMKAYEGLSRENPITAHLISEIYGDMKETLVRESARAFDRGRYNPSLSSYDPIRDQTMFSDYREEPVHNVQELTALNDRLARLYVGAPVEEFLKKISSQKEAPKVDETGGALAALPRYSRIIFETPEPTDDCRHTTWADVSDTKHLLISRLEEHERYFLQKRASLDVDAEKSLRNRDLKGMNRVTEILDHLRQEYRPAAAEIEKIKSIPLNNIPEALALLKRVGPSVFEAEERYLRSNLRDKIETLPGSPTWTDGNGREQKLKDILGDISPFSAKIFHVDVGGHRAFEQRIARYQRLNDIVNEKGTDAAVSETISHLESQETKAHRSDWIKRHVGVMVGPDPIPDMIEGLKIARGMIRSDDSQVRARGYEALRQLNNASQNEDIKGKVASLRWYERYVENFAVPAVTITASMALGGITTKFMGPLATRFLGQTAAGHIAFWSGTAVFNISNRLLTAKYEGAGVVNELKNMAAHPIQTGVGVLFDGLMMHYQNFVTGRVGRLAENSLGLKGWSRKLPFPVRFPVTVGALHVWNNGVLSVYRNLENNGSFANVISDLTHPNLLHDAAFLFALETFGNGIFRAAKNFDAAEELGIKIARLDKTRLKLEAEIDGLQSLRRRSPDRSTALSLTNQLEGLLEKYRDHLAKSPEKQRNSRAYALNPEKLGDLQSKVEKSKQRLLKQRSPANDNGVPDDDVAANITR